MDRVRRRSFELEVEKKRKRCDQQAPAALRYSKLATRDLNDCVDSAAGKYADFNDCIDSGPKDSVRVAVKDYRG